MGGLFQRNWPVEITYWKHGLHVMDDVYIEDCPYCGQRAKIKAMARMQGFDPEVAVADPAIARELVGGTFDRELFYYPSIFYEGGLRDIKRM